MIKLVQILFLCAFCTGCATLVDRDSQVWFAISEKDEFTDGSTCIATVGHTYKIKGKTFHKDGIFPFVANHNGQLRVGLKRGGRLNIPVGDVQLRIDANDAWSISTSETPLDAVPSNPAIDTLKNNKHAVVGYGETMAAVVRSMSPFTVSTGEKAEAILKQMLAGENMIFRTIGLNQASSTTGRAVLDDSLRAALAECQIDLPI